ncbi:MAG: hypothetical protein ACFFED_08660 [Candidatus Thorarchaeota archaeon]
MVNTRKIILRERTRLRRSQNPQQTDFRKMRKARMFRTKFWSIKAATKAASVPAVQKTKGKEKEKSKTKEKPKKEKKPELEVIDEEPEMDVIDEELEEIYSLDDEDLEDFDDEDSE